jgi:hypothetical protein
MLPNAFQPRSVRIEAARNLTTDGYGHLFPRGDDAAELAAAEKAFLTA